MQEVLNFIGLCPDSLSHQDFLDIFILNYQEFINTVNKGYEKVKNLG